MVCWACVGFLRVRLEKAAWRERDIACWACLGFLCVRPAKAVLAGLTRRERDFLGCWAKPCEPLYCQARVAFLFLLDSSL